MGKHQKKANNGGRSLAALGDYARPDLEAQVAALAAQVRRLGERLAPNEVPASPPAPDGTSSAKGLLNERVLAAAEAVAAEIRADAEREAERIRSGAQLQAARQIEQLRAMVAQQREAVATLVREAEQLEQSVAAIRAQADTLDAELLALDESIGMLQAPQ